MIGEEWSCRKWGARPSSAATSTHRAAPAGAGSEFIMEGTRVGALKKQRWPDEISFRKQWSPTGDGAARFLKIF
ncbi:hypothetical protein I7820_10250 [Burkholderia cenocepacia]|uniref:hypothetical protein n=1 Tax=Burkholderia cenocepacia TaxID=95486 RepID=UPI00190867BB|nr:hypothetical protein [Burkholderia cenocepacia]MBJ9877538.1 hypothetical protein [Burkholderia cenocepacia]